MKKQIADLIITKKIFLNEQYVLIKLTWVEKLPKILPGQFAQIKVENSPNTFLRRPLSICNVDREKNELWLLIQIVGDGTHKMSELNEGDKLNLVYPLGNSFSLPTDKTSRNLLVGGGVGVAPMLIWGKYLSENNYQCDFLLGARSKKDLLLLNEFRKYGEVYTTTEDATMGEKGFVTNHSILREKKYNQIYTCGPTPMMKAVASYASEQHIFCEASLENMMGCGFGACLCCVTDTTEGNLCVCSEGPIFNITKLKWQI